MTARNMILAAALAAGCNEGLEQKVDETQAPQEEVKTLVLEAVQDARIREASPDENFDGQNGYVGCSADGFDRYLVQFDAQKFPDGKINSAKLEVDALSGTCLSSYIKEICNLPIEVRAYAITNQWGEQTVTWNTQPGIGDRAVVITESGMTQADLNHNTVVQVPYQGTGRFDIDVTALIQHAQAQSELGQGVYGLMLKAANDTVETREFAKHVFPKEKPEDPQRYCGREVQRDVVLGSPLLVITYQ